MIDTVEDAPPLDYQVFALAFTEPGAIEYFAEHLPVSAVGGSNKHGLTQFYATMLDFYNKTHIDPIDPIAFRSWLESETDIYKALGGAEMVNIFIDTMLSLDKSDPESVSAILRFQANKRKQLEYVQELQSLLAKKGKLDPELKDKVSKLTDQIRGLESELDYNPLARVVTGNDIVQTFDMDAFWEVPEFLSTQFVDLNKCMGYTAGGGFFRGAVHAIIAQSGAGKSTFAKVLMNNWLDQGHTCLYVNFEEPQALWERTLFCQITGHNIYYGIDDEDKKAELTAKFMNKVSTWGDRMMARHDPDTSYFEDLESWLRDLIGHGENVPDVVVIDTIQSLFTKGKVGQRWGQFEEIMVRLEKLARDMNAVFIITAQENRDRMKEGREVVKQSDAGGSATIIQKCAVTIFLTEQRKRDESAEEGIMELQIPKNRITGKAFMLSPARVRYDDGSKSYVPYDMISDDDYPNMETIEIEDDY